MLIKSGAEQSKEEMMRAAARAQSKLQCADRYIGAILASSDFPTLQDRNTQPDEVAGFALEVAEAQLSKWELATHPIEGSEQ